MKGSRKSAEFQKNGHLLICPEAQPNTSKGEKLQSIIFNQILSTFPAPTFNHANDKGRYVLIRISELKFQQMS